MIEWLKEQFIEMNHLNEPTYSLLKIKSVFEVVELIEENAWLVLKWDEEKLWLHFAVLEFHSQIYGEENIELTQCFHGEGPSGALRECRHTYWGEKDNGGYIFYPKKRTIIAALDELSKYFDLD